MVLFADFGLGDLLVAMLAFFFLFLAIWMFIAARQYEERTRQTG